MALKFPLQNLRQRIDGAWEQVLVVETITVPASADANGDYIVHLEEVPDNGDVNYPLIVFDSVGNLTPVPYPPTIGDYYINYGTGRLALTSYHAGQSLSAEYYKKGSLIEAEDINYLHDRVSEDYQSNYVIQPTKPLSGETFVGKVWYNTVNGLQYTYDGIRDKWISTNRQTLVFGKSGNTKNQYLNYYTSQMPCNLSGLRMLRDACITGVTVQTETAGTCDFLLRKNDSETTLVTVHFDNQDTLSNELVDFDINAGDDLQVYLDTSGAGYSQVISNPIIMIEYTWRI